MVARFANYSNRNIDALVQASILAKDRASLSSLLRSYAATVIATDRKPERFMRAQVMARAASDERFRALLIPEFNKAFKVFWEHRESPPLEEEELLRM
jgi:hypothetical protein